jgi:N-hydroxyarylamine O-acetyltransferase
VNLDAYLARIDYHGPRDPTWATLAGVHRAHAQNVTYENLDIHLGRRLTMDPAAAFGKIVAEGRGGWCYEMNGLLGWALGELGFPVSYLAGTVGREVRGPSAEGNHLVLMVELDRAYLADVGFGDGLIEPIPLEPGRYQQGLFDFTLRVVDQRWHFDYTDGGGLGFDFTLTPRQLADFETRCHYLQTSPDSGFVKSTVCQRHGPADFRTLRGAVFRRLTATGAEERVVESAEDYCDLLEGEFDLPPTALARLWPAVAARHAQWLLEQQQR